MGNSVLVSRDGATGVMALNRPDKRNAIDIPMRRELGEAVAELRDDPSVKVVLIHGTGEHFCGGGDLFALTEEERSTYQNRERIRDLHRWFRELVNLEKPVIAAIDGVAFGAGLNLALAADFILCSERARFCAVFQRIGVLPDLGGLFLLPRIVGLQRAKDLIFTARELDANEAQGLGIVHSIYPASSLLDEARAFAVRFHSASTEALGIAKHILNQSFHLDQHAVAELEAANQALAFASPYHLDAVARFKRKEEAPFRWE